MVYKFRSQKLAVGQPTKKLLNLQELTPARMHAYVYANGLLCENAQQQIEGHLPLIWKHRKVSLGNSPPSLCRQPQMQTRRQSGPAVGEGQRDRYQLISPVSNRQQQLCLVFTPADGDAVSQTPGVIRALTAGFKLIWSYIPNRAI